MANRLQRQRPSLPPILLHSTLALAIARMSGATWLGMSLLAVTPSVMAQSNSVHTFNIPAGPLEGALNRFGKETGILLSFSPETTSGLRSPGLRGTFNVQEGLATVLSGTGVQALPQPNGNILLRRQPVTSTPEMTSATSTLSEVRVVGSRIADGTTEGTGSYTAAGPSSMSAGLGLTSVSYTHLTLPTIYSV